MQKALIYCRVSSERQVKEGNGLSSQEQRCRMYATTKGYSVVKVFPDEGISGAILERPEIKRLLSYLDENSEEKYVVIIDDISRLARDVKVHLNLKVAFLAKGARIESPNFNFENSPEGGFIETVFAAKAQLDREQNRRQVIQKMKARIAQGFWPFCPPPGLKNKYHPVHKKVLIPEESISSIIKGAIEGYRDGQLNTLEQVASFLDSRYVEHGIHRRTKTSNQGAQNILNMFLNNGQEE